MSKQSPLDDRCSPWPWSQVATMSSDFTFIRRIEDDDGNVVAQVRYVDDDTDANTQGYANARVLQLAPEMAQALRLIYNVLADHPEASTGNSKVHYALMAAYAMLNKMEKQR